MTRNSVSYASYEEREQWIAESIVKIPRAIRVPHPLLAEVDLIKEEIEDLQDLAAKFISHSLSIPPVTAPTEILKHLAGHQFKPDKTADEFLIPLERRITQILRIMHFEKSTSGMEYPINVRVVHGIPPNDFKKTGYTTTTVHSDLWAGEPADTVQILIPLMGDTESTRCQWYETDRHCFDHYLDNLSNYQDAQVKLGQVRAIPHSFEVGKLYVFDSALPHQSIQVGGGVRISLDFRLRRLMPYADLNWISRMRKSKGAYGKYYLFPPTPYPFAKFEQKIRREIEVLKNLNLDEFVKFRQEHSSK